MTAIFETADHAIFIRDIAEPVRYIHFPIAAPFRAIDYDPSTAEIPRRQRTYELFGLCHTIALYREKVV